MSFYLKRFKRVNFLRKFSIGFSLLILFVLFIYGATTVSGATQQPRVVAVADIHGAYDAFLTILQRAGVIDANRQWAGGNTVFIQLGDILDRGAKGRSSMDLLMQLEKQAGKTKGKAIVLLGNHEIMNLIGDLRYVPREEYLNYADGQSQKRQDDAYKAVQQLKRDQAKALKQPDPTFSAEMEKTWRDAHPFGYVEQREAFSMEGKYGQWLRKHSAILQLNGTVFLHGGLNPELSSMSIDDMNRRIGLEIQLFDAARKYLLAQKLILPFSDIEEIVAAAKDEAARLSQSGSQSDPEKAKLLQAVVGVGAWVSMNQGGPLWFRGFSEWSDEEGAPNIAKLIAAYKVEHFVVGHTVQPGGQIRARFNNQIFLMDTGMLDSNVFEGGRASALQIQDNHFSVIYPDQTVALP